ncbi:Nramp family divalent metal transporter [Methanocalculus sp.]|uniref:Nramp family divalent metal transporter n=1 Tax=Methanocalculus sp. TaxID=2004547 RepID=UPI0027276279|nr:Nramp family divalent metal transporter [Methanocalculus sp.]MDO8842457.1 Nramp family divalent metal transporter [Methanocalculus sp.]
MQTTPAYLPSGSTLRRRIAERLFFLGPVLILAIETSGESGLVEIMNAGLHSGYTFLWVFAIALIYKFAFAYGIARYTLSTGKTIFSGLRSIPGPRNWEVTFITIIYILEMAAYGGFLVIAGQFLLYLIPIEIPIHWIALITLGVILLLLWKGSYERLEHVILGMVVILFIGAIFSLSALNVPFLEVAEGFVPHLDPKHYIEIMALLGAVGAGLNLLLYSVWLHEKTGGIPCTHDLPEKMRIVRSDLLIGFGLIALMSFVFLGIGASYSDSVHIGEGISSAYTVSVHLFHTIPYAAPVFIFSSFILLAGAVLSGIDGRARAVCGILREAGGVQIPPKKLYRLILVGFSAIIFAAVFIGSPEYLIKNVSAIASILFAIIGFALIYIDNNLPQGHRGSRLWLAVMAVGSGIYLLVALLEEDTILSFGIPLMERLAIFLFILFLFVRSDLALAYRKGVATRTDLLWLILIFGALSIYGTFRGYNVESVIVSFKDIGPIIAGIIGGPIAGAAAGVIGGAYRYSLGGWTALPGAVATVVAGVLGGVAARRWTLTPLRLAILGVGAEAIQILILVPLLTLGAPHTEVLDVIRYTLLPMSVVTAAGLIMYLQIEEQFKRTVDMKDLISWVRQEIDPDLESDLEKP